MGVSCLATLSLRSHRRLHSHLGTAYMATLLELHLGHQQCVEAALPVTWVLHIFLRDHMARVQYIASPVASKLGPTQQVNMVISLCL